MRAASIAFVACALACGATASLAERADRDKEIVVGADKLTADDNSRTSTFEGSVVVTQGTMRMTANRVTVKEDADRHKYYVANGAPVTFTATITAVGPGSGIANGGSVTFFDGKFDG